MINKIEEDIITTLLLPLYLAATTGLVLLLDSWGRWLLFNDSANVPSYFTNKHNTALQSIFHGFSSASTIELLCVLLLSMLYLWMSFLYWKVIIKFLLKALPK